MNSVHIHLLLNHVAILAAVFSVLIFAYGFIRKNVAIVNLALVGFVLSAVTTLPVFLTGEPAEEAVEHLPGIVESVIEQHEEAAEIALWIIELTGVIALSGLLLRKKEWFSSNSFYTVIFLCSLGAVSSISYTGYLGGKIRHTEVAGGGAQNSNGEAGALESANGEGEHDDD